MKSITRDILIRKLSELERDLKNYTAYGMRADVVQQCAGKIELLNELLY